MRTKADQCEGLSWRLSNGGVHGTHETGRTLCDGRCKPAGEMSVGMTH